jgi:hypothetical protein
MSFKNENMRALGDDADASGVDSPEWLEACRREEAIRELLSRSDGERLDPTDVEEVALDLEVSRATLYPAYHDLSSDAYCRGARTKEERTPEGNAVSR